MCSYVSYAGMKIEDGVPQDLIQILVSLDLTIPTELDNFKQKV